MTLSTIKCTRGQHSHCTFTIIECKILVPSVGNYKGSHITSGILEVLDGLAVSSAKVFVGASFECLLWPTSDSVVKGTTLILSREESIGPTSTEASSAIEFFEFLSSTFVATSKLTDFLSASTTVISRGGSFDTPLTDKFQSYLQRLNQG